MAIDLTRFSQIMSVKNPEERQTTLSKEFPGVVSANELKDISSLNVEPTAIPDETTDSLDTLKNQAITALASATSQDDFFKSQQELFKQQQEELAKNQVEQKSWLDKAKEMIAGRKSSVETLKTEQEKLGVPAMWDNVKALIPEIGALNTQLAQLQTAENTEVLGIQQNPQYSVQFASREAQRVSREYAIKQAGVSAELGAKTALMQAYQGNITAANNMVGDIVNAMNYDTTQKLQDYNTFIDNNQTFINGLEKNQKDILDNIQNYWETKSKNDSEDYKSKLNMIIDAANKGVNLGIGVNDVKKMSLEDIASLYQSKVSGVVKEEKGVAGSETMFDDILQGAIDAGASASSAAQTALLFAEQNGISLTEKERNALIKKAKNLKPTPKVEAMPEPITPPAIPSVAKAGEKVRGAVGKAVKFFTEPFTETLIPTASSFFKGLFGK